MELKLPPSIIGYGELKRVLRALEQREEMFIVADKQPGQVLPAPNEAVLVDLAAVNGIDLNDRKVCQQLKKYIEDGTAKLPRMHLSFAVEPSAQVTEKLVVWLRQNIHPLVLVGIGIQPAIAAGCVLRTPNKIFDMSLRKFVDRQNEYLVELIKGAARGD